MSKTATSPTSKAAAPTASCGASSTSIPRSTKSTYPYQEKPGYWWFYEAGLGTNPKFFKRPDENEGRQQYSERNNSGVIHWGFGGSVVHDPDKPEESKAWIDFPKQNGLPKDHWWHIHNMMVTYKGRVRGTKNSWITIVDKGELTAYKSPEIRALASRYGDPNEVLAEDWIPHIPASRRREITRTTPKILENVYGSDEQSECGDL